MCRIDLDKIKIETYKIDGKEISEKQFDIIKRNLACALRYDDNFHFSKCEYIRVIYITKESDKLFNVEILFDCPIEGHMTPNMTTDVCISLDESNYYNDPLTIRYNTHKIDDEWLSDERIDIIDECLYQELEKDDTVHLNTYDYILIKNITKVSEELLNIELKCVGCIVENHDIPDLDKHISISIDKLKFWALGS